MGTFGHFGYLGRSTESDDADDDEPDHPYWSNRVKRSAETPPRQSAPPSRRTGRQAGGVRRQRRFTVEGDAALTVALLKGMRRISPGRDSVEIGMDGRQYRVRLYWSRRVLANRPIGWRGYFKCGCGRRCCALFRSDRGPACRFCSGLIHRSERLGNPQRWLRCALKIQRQLGLPTDRVLDKLERPKRMNRELYDRLWLRWCQARTRLRGRELTRKTRRRKSKPLVQVERW